MNKRMDKRRVVIPVLLFATLLLGAGVQNFSSDDFHSSVASDPEHLLRQQFEYAVSLLDQHEFESAVQGFHEVIKLAPELPEAHVNMGFALLGLERFEAAQDYFGSASTIRPLQSNAYYGLAVASEGLGEFQQAIVAMRTFVHIADFDDPFRRKAEAAIWEWEAILLAQTNDQ